MRDKIFKFPKLLEDFFLKTGHFSSQDPTNVGVLVFKLANH